MPENTSNYAELAENLKGIEGVTEDAAEYLARNWQKAIGVLVLALLAVWVIGEYQNASRVKLGEASQRYSNAQAIFSKIFSSRGNSENKAVEVSDKEPEADEDVAVLRENLSLLEEESHATYSKLAELYLAATEFVFGDKKAAANKLNQLISSNAQTSEKVLTSSEAGEVNFAEELARLIAARNFAGDRAEKRSKLVSLVKTGTFTNLEALISLVRISQSSEEKAEASQLAKALQDARPEQSEEIQSNLKQLGVSFK
jgi:hypothetical protein